MMKKTTENTDVSAIIKHAASVLDPAGAMIAKSVIESLTDDGSNNIKTPSLTQNALGVVIGDWVGEWRTRRLMSFVSETARVADRHGIDPEKLKLLPNGDRYRILDGATRTEDPLISAMWTSLLVSDLSDLGSRSRFIGLLDNMTGDDAKVLTFLYNAKSYGECLETALEGVDQIRSLGYEGEEKTSWRHRFRSQDRPDKAVYELSLKNAQENVEACSEPLIALEKEFLIGDINEARDALLRSGLIQRKSIEVPSTSDFESSLTVLASSSYQGGQNDWEDIRICDPEAVGTAIDELHNLIAEHTGYSRNDVDLPELVQYSNRFNVCPWVLTPLGEGLYEACALRA